MRLLLLLEYFVRFSLLTFDLDCMLCGLCREVEKSGGGSLNVQRNRNLEIFIPVDLRDSQIGSFIVVCEQLIVCVYNIKSCLIVDVTYKRRRHV